MTEKNILSLKIILTPKENKKHLKAQAYEKYTANGGVNLFPQEWNHNAKQFISQHCRTGETPSFFFKTLSIT